MAENRNLVVNDLGDYGQFSRTEVKYEDEILYSYSPPPLKKGGFLAAGQGLLPAGQVLAYNETSELFVKYDDVTPVNEVQTLTRGTPAPADGTVTVSFRGQSLVIDAADTAADVQAGLRGLSTIGANGVTVTGGPLASAHLVVTFTGNLAGQNVPMIVIEENDLVDGTDAAAGLTVVQTTAGVAGGAKAAAILARAADSGTDVNGRNQAINVYFRGQFKTDKLVGLDANAKTDLRAYEPTTAYGCTVIG